MRGEYNRQAIRELILAALTADQINDLALDLFPTIYQDFAEGMGTNQRVRAIVDYAGKNGRFPDLLEYIQQRNPEKHNEFASKLFTQTAPSQPTPAATPPAPIKLFYNAPYPLESNFKGRRKELAALDKWLADAAANPIFTIIALGGTGKSALAWRWLSDLQGRQATAITKIIWWDFYQTGSSVADFLADSLAFLGDTPPTNDNQRLQMNRLRTLLQAGRTLLVMDGAERLLRAYSNMNAAYQGDEEIETTSDQARYNRDTVDPVMSAFLRGLSQSPGSKSLITTRLLPRDLEGQDGNILPGIKRINLTGLDPEDAYQLFRDLKVKASRAEVKAVSQPLGYHPLSLRLLAGYVANDPSTPNDLRAAADFDPNEKVVGQNQNHILQQAYNSLTQPAQQTLSKLAAFRGGVDWPVLQAVFEDDKELQDNLLLLQRRGLLQRSTNLDPITQLQITNYQLHPIVRRYAYDRLTNPTATHNQLASYFEAVPKPTKIQTLADLAPTIELYHHLARAGQYDEAMDLAYNRLGIPMYFQFGAYLSYAELLQALFPDGESKLPRLKREDAQTWTLTALANSYGQAGRPNSAVPLFEQQIAIREKQGNKKSLAIGLGNLGYMAQIQIGALKAADTNLRRSIELSREIEDRRIEAVGHRERGRLLAYWGDWVEATAELDTALEQFTVENHIQSQGIVWAYRALFALLQGEGETAEQAAAEALRLTDEDTRIRYPHPRDYVQAYWLLGWATLVNGNLALASQHLDQALRRCRTINMVEHEPAILLAQAQLARANDNVQQALDYAAEAQLIAERAGYVLYLADIHNFLAQLALDENDKESARKHAAQAKEYAYCDGPPYAYKVAYDEAERLLAEIG